MPSFRYTANSLKGEKKEGVLEAKDKYHLARILRKQGFILVKAKAEKEKKKKKI